MPQIYLFNNMDIKQIIKDSTRQIDEQLVLLEKEKNELDKIIAILADKLNKCKLRGECPDELRKLYAIDVEELLRVSGYIQSDNIWIKV